MKKTPFLIALIATIVLFEILGLFGSMGVYANEEHDIVKEPVLSKVFTGINNGIYPWEVFDSAERSRQLEVSSLKKQKEEELLKRSMETEETPAPLPTATPQNTPKPQVSPTPSPTPTPESKYPKGKIEPLRESTYDEYINHISADIYGDIGVLRAAEYEFKTVGLDYFDDALFIGDSRMVGLRDYTDLKDHADFCCETSLTISKVFTSDFKGKGGVEKALKAKDYGKIYIMVGVNELGTGTTEDFIAVYEEVINRLHELEPEAKIFILSIMNIDKERSDSDNVFNNTNILGRNNAIATLADNEVFFYININEAVCDENGYLRDDLRGDHLHLMGASNSIVEEFLLEHGV